MNKTKKILLPSLLVLACIISIIGFFAIENQNQDHDGKLVSTHYSLYVEKTPTQRAQDADLILTGLITNVSVVEAKLNLDDPWPIVFTYLTIEPIDVLKGTPITDDNGMISLPTLGGETEKRVSISDSLSYEVGDKVFFYLTEQSILGHNYAPTNPSVMYKIYDIGLATNYYHQYTYEGWLLEKHKKIIQGLK